MNKPVTSKALEGAVQAPAPFAGDIHARMVEILRELDAIGKNARNQAQGFNYRGIDDVYNAINPILARYGVYMTAEVVGKTREERVNNKGTVLAFTCLHMRYHFRAEDGTSVSTEAEGEGMDSGDKSSNKAMAVAHKYALLQAFCVPTKDLEDPDGEVHVVTAPQTQREAIHTPKTMQPPQDDDVVQGTLNWVNDQKAGINATIENGGGMEALQAWLDKNGGSFDKPKSSSNLDRLKRKFPEAFRDLHNHYITKLNEV